MAAHRRVYDSRHLQADCQEPGSAPERYARQSSMGDLLTPLLRFQRALLAQQAVGQRVKRVTVWSLDGRVGRRSVRANPSLLYL